MMTVTWDIDNLSSIASEDFQYAEEADDPLVVNH